MRLQSIFFLLPVTFVLGGCLMDLGEVHTRVAVGHMSACAIDGAGELDCWGVEAEEPPAGEFLSVAVGLNWTSFSACAIQAADRKVVCWGDSLGTPPTDAFSAISVGEEVACGITSAGALRCWGGNASVASKFDATNYTAVAIGSDDECVLTTTGEVVCNDPTGVPTGSRFTKVVSGGFITDGHACALAQDGAVSCWGSMSQAQPGPFIDIAAGKGFTCGLKAGGKAECWGKNDWGATDAPSTEYVAIAAGVDNACGIEPSGAIECWGYDSSNVTDGP